MSEFYDWQQDAAYVSDVRRELRAIAQSYEHARRSFMFVAGLDVMYEGVAAPLNWKDVIIPFVIGLFSIHFGDRANTFERLAESAGPSTDAPAELELTTEVKTAIL